jgi:cytidylate kinase
VLERAELREQHAGEAASVVAAHPQVRAALIAFQKAFAAREPGAVLDGRDIGSVVCPDADVKLYVTASLAERARRRWLELKARDPAVALAEVEADIAARDERDRNRPVSPLVQAPDAHLLDTTNLDIEAAFRAAIDLIEGAVSV